MWAKQSTAATLIGPILDSTGAEYAGAVIGDLSISKNGGTLTALAAAATLTVIANGQYTLVLTTGNLDTLGRAQITCNKATYQMPAVNLMVVPAMVFDSMILGTDVLTADVTQIGGDTQSATDLKDFADAGYDPATNTVAAELDSASVDAIWNEVLTGATHNIASSAGRRLRQLADTVVLVDGVCDAASNAGTDSTGTITLEVGTTTACVGQAIRSENQVRFIASYDAGTRVAQLDRPWCVVPDAGDEYVIFNVRNPLVGLASLALAGSTAAAVNDINAVTDKVDTGLVLDGVVYQFTENMLELGPSGGGGGGGDATLAKQEEILAALQGVEAIQVASPNVQGNLVLTQGDDYDGVANPRAQWNVTTDYTTGWTVRLTIRDKDDAVIYTNTGSVVSATVVAVTIAAPTGLEMTGCPGQWQGKFDVELTHSSGKKKTIALGVCYINEDQTRA
jgi:hypothetical protein